MGLRLFNTQIILCHSIFSYIKCDMCRKYIFRITTVDDVFIKEKIKQKIAYYIKCLFWFTMYNLNLNRHTSLAKYELHVNVYWS